MGAISIDIATMLQTEDLSLVQGTNLFVSRQPTTPDATVTIYDTGTGRAAMLTNDRGDYNYQNIQVAIRRKTYPEAMALAETIKDTLHGRANMPLNGYLYALISHSSGPALLEWDTNNRAVVVINFNVQRRQL